jgi:predicted kinase
MKELIMLAGIPGSGKSTWARSYKKEHPATYIVDSDETRKKLMGSYLIFPNDMHIIFDDMVKDANAILLKHPECTVILDSIFLDDYRRRYFMERIKGYDRSLLLLVKMHNYSACYRNNRMRIQEKWVPDHVIGEMIAEYRDPAPEVAALFDEVRTVYFD